MCEKSTALFEGQFKSEKAGSSCQEEDGQHLHSAEKYDTGLVAAMKVPDYVPLKDPHVFLADPWRVDWDKGGVQVTSNPEKNMRGHDMKRFPGLSSKRKFNNQKTFSMPRAMMKTKSRPSPDPKHSSYDLDALDITWLQSMNQHLLACGADLITEDTMEKLIEAFEDSCFAAMHSHIQKHHAQGLGIEFDEDSTCVVCLNPDSCDDNEIVFCDGCDIAVHQGCYGIQCLPEENWFCSLCLANLPEPPHCELCTVKGGAMKRIKGCNRWCHVSCCLWIPETCFEDPYKMEPVINIGQIPQSRRQLICCVCRERKGACVQCNTRGCTTSYHVTCAMKGGLEVSTEIVENSEDVDEITFVSYCLKHTVAREKKTQERRERELGRSPPSVPTPPKDSNSITPPRKCWTPRVEGSRTPRKVRLERIENKFYDFVSLDQLVVRYRLSRFLISLVFEYWKLKRKSAYNKQLLTQTGGIKQNTHVLDRMGSDIIVLTGVYIDLRREMEKMRNLMYLCVRREKTKRSLQLAEMDLVDAEIRNIEAELENIPTVGPHGASSSKKPCNDYSRSGYLFYKNMFSNAVDYHQKTSRKRRFNFDTRASDGMDTDDNKDENSQSLFKEEVYTPEKLDLNKLVHHVLDENIQAILTPSGAPQSTTSAARRTRSAANSAVPQRVSEQRFKKSNGKGGIRQSSPAKRVLFDRGDNAVLESIVDSSSVEESTTDSASPDTAKPNKRTSHIRLPSYPSATSEEEIPVSSESVVDDTPPNLRTRKWNPRRQQVATARVIIDMTDEECCTSPDLSAQVTRTKQPRTASLLSVTESSPSSAEIWTPRDRQRPPEPSEEFKSGPTENVRAATASYNEDRSSEFITGSESDDLQCYVMVSPTKYDGPTVDFARIQSSEDSDSRSEELGRPISTTSRRAMKIRKKFDKETSYPRRSQSIKEEPADIVVPGPDGVRTLRSSVVR